MRFSRSYKEDRVMGKPAEVEEFDNVFYVAMNRQVYPARVERVHRSFLDKEGGLPGWVNLLIYAHDGDDMPYGVVCGATYDPDKTPGTWHWRQ